MNPACGFKKVFCVKYQLLLNQFGSTARNTCFCFVHIFLRGEEAKGHSPGSADYQTKVFGCVRHLKADNNDAVEMRGHCLESYFVFTPFSFYVIGLFGGESVQSYKNIPVCQEAIFLPRGIFFGVSLVPGQMSRC